MNQSLSIFEQVGISIPPDLTDNKVSTVFSATGLDWQVVQKPIYYDNATNHFQQDSYVNLPQFVGNFRSDTNQFLGLVHPTDYKVVQNIEAFNFIDDLTDFTYEKVGMFDNGKKVYIVGKTSEKITIDSGDDIDFYMTFLHGHNGKSSIKLILSPIRMFCTNQMNMMLNSSIFKYTVKHLGDVATKLSQVHHAINDSHLYVQDLQNTINTMLTQKPSKPIDQFVIDLIPIDDSKDTSIQVARKESDREAIKTLYNEKPDLQNYKGSTFGMYSAVSDFISHSLPRRVTKSALANRFINNLEGNSLLEQARLLLAA